MTVCVFVTETGTFINDMQKVMVVMEMIAGVKVIWVKETTIIEEIRIVIVMVVMMKMKMMVRMVVV